MAQGRDPAPRLSRLRALLGHFGRSGPARRWRLPATPA